MGEHHIALSSITYANKAKSYLSRNGITSHIVRTPRSIVSCGCGFSIEVDGDVNYAADLLTQAGIKIVAIY